MHGKVVFQKVVFQTTSPPIKRAQNDHNQAQNDHAPSPDSQQRSGRPGLSRPEKLPLQAQNTHSLPRKLPVIWARRELSGQAVSVLGLELQHFGARHAGPAARRLAPKAASFLVLVMVLLGLLVVLLGLVITFERGTTVDYSRLRADKEPSIIGHVRIPPPCATTTTTTTSLVLESI